MYGAQVSEAVEGPGETLQAARQAMEISCREVAEALNLPIRTVEAIEANDYEQLPGAVFTRGYIRAYARLLELDSDPVVARYTAGDTDTQTLETEVAQPLQGLVREHPQWVVAAAGLAALAVVIALSVWLWPAADDAVVIAPAPAAVETGTPSPTDVVAPAPAPSAVEPEAQTAPRSTPELPSQTAQPDSPRVAANAPATEQLAPGLPQSGPLAPTPAGLSRITPTGSDQLWFQFSEDCWVEIKSTTGASLYSDLSRAGRTLELIGEAPFRILLGYAPGVEMSFNDEVVALAPHTRNNVANLVLGQ
jgi:cytoskeleton protein RodZ